MKTDDLVSMLATGLTPVEPRAAARRFGIALGWATFGSSLLMAVWLGVRTDLAQAAAAPMFWVKLAFPAALVAGGLVAALRLARPGASLGSVPLALAAPVLALWALATVVLVAAEPAQRSGLVMGETWAECPVSILALAAPAFVAVLWAMRGLAPTRLALAGAVAGLLAGAIGALVYALHCPELAAPFLGMWYVAGIAAATLIGALVGPRILRW
jgi:hypothetical protein